MGRFDFALIYGIIIREKINVKKLKLNRKDIKDLFIKKVQLIRG